jgi:hypothetical protein
MRGTALSGSCGVAELGGFTSFLSLSLSLSLSTIQAEVAYPVILAQPEGISMTGKFDLAFRLRGHSVARCRTIPPGANGSQDVAVSHRTGALQDQGTMHPPIGANDEADLHFHSRIGRNQGGIRSHQSLWRPRVLTTRSRAHMREIAILGGAPEPLPELPLAFTQDGMA